MIRHKLTLTTAADGSVTGYTPRVSGKVRSVEYAKTDYADTVDFAITAEATGETIWTEANVTASKVCNPRIATHSNAGVAATLDGTRPALTEIAIASDRVKIAITSGGDTKTGTFHVLIDN